MDLRITSPLKLNYRHRGEVEAWFNPGHPFDEWPDWVRSYYLGRHMAIPRGLTGMYAIRDEDGYFWRWMKADAFSRLYERITP